MREAIKASMTAEFPSTISTKMTERVAISSLANVESRSLPVDVDESIGADEEPVEGTDNKSDDNEDDSWPPDTLVMLLADTSGQISESIGLRRQMAKKVLVRIWAWWNFIWCLALIIDEKVNKTLATQSNVSTFDDGF